MAGVAGATLFARYAYPPNELGYCGPDASRELLERAATPGGDADGGLRRLARGFEGAWPYLELIAHANGLADPLDRRVVEAYWVGNPLLDAVGVRALGDCLDERFRGRGTTVRDGVVQAVVGAGAGGASQPHPVPHHSFHVLAVYPWVGLLRSGVHGEPLRVLDRCRIRWGRVLEVGPTRVLVRSRPLVWTGAALTEGPAVVEQAVLRAGGHSLAPALAPGDWCSLHWDWVCDRLDGRAVTALRRTTARHLAMVSALPAPPACVLA